MVLVTALWFLDALEEGTVAFPDPVTKLSSEVQDPAVAV
jgi:hypothetical protein